MESDNEISLYEQEVNKVTNSIDRRIRLFNSFGWIFVILGFISIIGMFSVNTNTLELNEIGDYIGGTAASIWSLAGLFFIYVAFLNQQKQLKIQSLDLQYSRQELKYTRAELKGQKEQLEKQNHNLEKQNFENTFFHLLDLHKKNLDVWQIKENIKKNNELIRTDKYDKYWAVYKYLIMILRDYYKIKSKKPEWDERVINKKVLESFSFYDNYFRTIREIIEFIKTYNLGDKEIYEKIFIAQLSDEEILLSKMYFDSIEQDHIVEFFDSKIFIDKQKFIDKALEN